MGIKSNFFLEEKFMIKRQKDRKFELVSKFKPAGDQEQAIDELTAGFKKGYKEQMKSEF